MLGPGESDFLLLFLQHLSAAEKTEPGRAVASLGGNKKETVR